MVKLIISGICGRMGKSIGLLALEDKDIEIVGALESSDGHWIGKDIGDALGICRKFGVKVESDFRKSNSLSDCLVEFTNPKVTIVHLEVAIEKKIGMVIGTTAFSSKEVEKIKDASKNIPIVFSPNMSIGANLLFKLTEDVSLSLNKDYEVKIIEAHHSHKKDAPSGTAKRLAEVVRNVRHKTPPIDSIREGDIVGEHSVIFSGNYERIEIRHTAHSRDTFAKAALDAAKFLVGKKSGLYSMQDVIAYHTLSVAGNS